jgi:hypothetical protein
MACSKRRSHQGKESGLLASAGDLHALELALQPDVNVEAAGIFMEVKERA